MLRCREVSHNQVKMTIRQPYYSKEEYARRGDEIYETQVRAQVEEGNHGKIVEIAPTEIPSLEVS